MKERRAEYAQHGEQIARLEERMIGLDQKFNTVAANTNTIAQDMTAIRLSLASTTGAAKTINYIVHFCIGIGGIFVGWLGLSKHP